MQQYDPKVLIYDSNYAFAYICLGAPNILHFYEDKMLKVEQIGQKSILFG